MPPDEGAAVGVSGEIPQLMIFCGEKNPTTGLLVWFGKCTAKSTYLLQLAFVKS